MTTRPSAGQLNDFLDLGSAGGAGRPSTLPSGRPGILSGAVAGGAAGEFLRNSGARPGTLPAAGLRPDAGNLPARPNAGDRPGAGDRLGANQPSRIENREQRQTDRGQRRDEVRNQVQENHPRLDFWSDHPNWAAWRINRPYRWATWGALTGWVGYGWSDSVPYSYGENVYYDDGSVYYGDEPVATADAYAEQAEAIVAAAPEIDAAKAEWMPLGIFALTPDGQSSGPDPSLFLQLAISKEGVISGTLHNTATGRTETIDGMADKATQRTAWTVAGKTRPIMETGIVNLTEDSAPALVHFADGQTQQWLMVRLSDPDQTSEKPNVPPPG